MSFLNKKRERKPDPLLITIGKIQGDNSIEYYYISDSINTGGNNKIKIALNESSNHEPKNEESTVIKKIIIDQAHQNEKNTNLIYSYLYGIDRNNHLHIFDIYNKRWITSKKIFEINLDKNAESFRKDYQYEGTILYNTLTGVYILTGEKTDILYFYNSLNNSISKINFIFIRKRKRSLH